MKLWTWIRSAALCLGVSVIGTQIPTTARAQDAETFYRGSIVKFVVGSAPGGGYDTFARLLAPHLADTLGATVVVENVPGAGGLTALNRQYTSKPDGLQIMIVNGVAAAMSQIVDLESVRFDLSKLGLLGIVNAEPWVWLISAKSPHSSVADVVKSDEIIRWGASGFISGLADGAAMTCEALDVKCRIIAGYKGSSEVALALGRGEADAMYVSELPAQNYVSSGLAKNIASIARARPAAFPDVPTIFEAMQLTPDQKAKIDFRISIDELGRILVLPPGVTQDRLAHMQKAVRKIMNAPAVLAEAKKRDLYIDYRNPEQTRALMDSIFIGLTPEIKARVKEVATKSFR